MPYSILENFSAGLDSRHHFLTSKPGSLEALTNGHITRGGDIEKRKAFEIHKTLPDGTFGIEVTSGGLVTFGSGADPGVPSGVTYQKLNHPYNLDGRYFKLSDSGGTIGVWFDVDDSGTTIPDGAAALTRSIEVTTVTSGMTATEVASVLAAALQADGAFTSTSSEGIVTVTQSVAGVVANCSQETTTFSDFTITTGGSPGVAQVETFVCTPESVAMVSLDVSTVFSGKTWAVATFTDGLTVAFYDAAQITDFYDGVVRADMLTFPDDMVEEFAVSFNGDTRFNAGAGTNVLSVEAGVGEDFSIAGTATNVNGGTDDQMISVSTVRDAVSAIDEVQSVGEFQVASEASGTIDSVTIGSVHVFNSSAAKQETTIVCVADVSSSLDGTYFIIYRGSGSVMFWIDVSGTATMPTAEVADFNYEVTGITTGMSSSDVAIKVDAAIDAYDSGTPFTSALVGSTCVVTHNDTGNLRVAYDGDTGFAVTTTNHGRVKYTASNENTAALVSAAINQFPPVSASVSSVNVVTPGAYMLVAPTVTFSAPPSGVTATGYAVTNTVFAWGSLSTNNYNYHYFHSLVSIVITDAGSGYVSPPTITLGGSYKNYDATYRPSKSSATQDPTLTVVLQSASEPINYTSSVKGDRVIVTADEGVGAEANGLLLSYVVDTAGGSHTALTTIKELTGGVDSAAGQTKLIECTFSGTYDVGDVYSLAVTDSNLDETIFGGTRVASISPVGAKTFRSKMHVIAGPSLFYSRTAVPSAWEDDAFGSGVINLQETLNGSEALTGIATYQGNLVIFSRRSAQIWYIDPDDTANQQLQVLENIGSLSPLSIQSVGNSDVFFLSDSGIRSLRVRDSSNNAFVSDVGTPIDTLVLADLASITEADKAIVSSVIEPVDGRYWLVINGEIYVFSFFPSSKVSAWSKYIPEYSLNGAVTTMGTISKIVTHEDRVYARSQMAQIETITCVADVSSNLAGTHFIIHDDDQSVAVGFTVGGVGTVIHGSDRYLGVDVAVNATAEVVAAAVAAAVTADASFTATSALGVVTITQAVEGYRTAATDNNAGVTPAIVKAGGDYIFNYGGANNDSYDVSVCGIEIPYLDASKPGTRKLINALDFSADGTWVCDVNNNTANNGAWEEIGSFTGSTFADGAFPVSGLSTHMKLRLNASGAEYARLAQVLVHFQTGESQ